MPKGIPFTDESIGEGIFRKVDSLLAAGLLLSASTPVVYGSRLTGTPMA